MADVLVDWASMLVIDSSTEKLPEVEVALLDADADTLKLVELATFELGDSEEAADADDSSEVTVVASD
jgi:hypothetical protein